MHVSKWGNSLAIRIPASLAEELDLKAGDEVSIRTAETGGFLVERKASREELIQRIQAMAKPMPAGFKFNRDELYDR